MRILIQCLIASCSFVLATGGAIARNSDQYTHTGSKSDLQRRFEIGTDFRSDGVITLKFNRSSLDKIDEKRCAVKLYVRYLVGEGAGYATSWVSHFYERHGVSIEIFDETLDFGGSIFLAMNVIKGRCDLDPEYSYSGSIFFPEGMLMSQ